MDADPDLIREEIDRTRAEMADTAAEIQHRLNVGSRIGHAIGDGGAALRTAVGEARTPAPGATGAAGAADRASRALGALRGHSVMVAALVWIVGAALVLVLSPRR